MNTGFVEQSAERLPVCGMPSAAKIWLKAIELTARIEAEPGHLFADEVDAWARKQPDRPALISDGENLSCQARCAAAGNDDVAAMGEYLLAEGGRNVTGSVLTIDAGNTA
jgi:hypothetical protein